MIRELKKEGDEVERGTQVTVSAIFCDDPVEVCASFIQPGQNRAIVDPGFQRKGSRVRRLSKGIYTYVIDTTGFKPGKVTWHIWGTAEASDFGWFTIKDQPAQLL